MHATRRLVVPILAALLLACSKDSTGVNPVNLSGNWVASWSNVAGGGISCGVSGITLALSQTGTAFSGTYSAGSVNCSGPGGTSSNNFSSGTIANGHISGDLNSNSIAFDLDTPVTHQSGSVGSTGNTMSGTATWQLDTDSGTITLTGNWSATR